MKVDSTEINNVLAQMRALAGEARGPAAAPPEAEGKEPTDFGALLKDSIDHVNRTSGEASELAQAFERGEPGVELAQVMVALQKSSISFQAMLQVRNRLVQAYKDISSMPI